MHAIAPLLPAVLAGPAIDAKVVDGDIVTTVSLHIDATPDAIVDALLDLDARVELSHVDEVVSYRDAQGRLGAHYTAGLGPFSASTYTLYVCDRTTWTCDFFPDPERAAGMSATVGGYLITPDELGATLTITSTSELPGWAPASMLTSAYGGTMAELLESVDRRAKR